MKNKNMCTLEELNLQAAMLKGRGDLEGVIRLAEANGLTVRTAERYLMGEEPTLTTQKELAIGRLLLESVDLDLRQSVVLTGILTMVNKAVREDPKLQEAVISNKRSLLGCVGHLLRLQSKARNELPDEIAAVCGLTMIQDIPEWAAREAIKEYYLEKTSTDLAIANTYVDFQNLQKIDADFIISILDEAEQEYPEHKPIYEMFRDVINAVPTAAEIVSQEDTEE